MKTIKKRLSEEQIKKGIIFTSTLSTQRTEQSDDNVHEVYECDLDKYEKIDRLYDTSFFKNSPFKFNIIRIKQTI